MAATRNDSWRRSLLVAAAAAMCALALVGCRQDMHNQPKMIPLRASGFWIDGRSARPILSDTVARGQLMTNPYEYSGDINGKPGRGFPFPITAADLDRGELQFNIYCAPCHSRVGDGNGMIVQRGYLRPPSFHEPRLINAPEGYIFQVITNGLGGMPDYAEQITTADRWRIIAYLRALQLSWRGNPSMAPAGVTIGPPSLPPPAEPGGAGPNEMNPRRQGVGAK